MKYLYDIIYSDRPYILFFLRCYWFYIFKMLIFKILPLKSNLLQTHIFKNKEEAGEGRVSGQWMKQEEEEKRHLYLNVYKNGKH